MDRAVLRRSSTYPRATMGKVMHKTQERVEPRRLYLVSTLRSAKIPRRLTVITDPNITSLRHVVPEGSGDDFDEVGVCLPTPHGINYSVDLCYSISSQYQSARPNPLVQEYMKAATATHSQHSLSLSRFRHVEIRRPASLTILFSTPTTPPVAGRRPNQSRNYLGTGRAAQY